MRTSRGRIDQCTAVQGRGGRTGEQGLRVQGCQRFTLKQMNLQGAENRNNRERELCVGVCLSLKESQDVKCAGAVSAAVFRGESTR